MAYPISAAQLVDGEVCGLVNALSQAMDRHTRQVAERFGLTAPQAVALRELPEPRTLRELAQRMSCEASNATFVADRLESLGLLERQPHPTDRRSKVLHLTAQGTVVREELVRQLKIDAPINKLTPDEQLALRELLIRATG